MIGGIEIEEGAAAALARDLDIVVTSVEYRLAPEHPYPAGLDDCTLALQWLHDHAGDLAVDPARIGVYGESAGGGLAAALALRSRDRGGPPICFQFLGIPELDDRLESWSSRTFVDTPMWNRPLCELSWRYYLRDVGPEVPYDAAPARAPDLSSLPPAYVTAMEYDPLRDEEVEYASRLLQAGVSVELHVYPSTFHGAAFLPSAISDRINEEARAALRRGLRLGR